MYLPFNPCLSTSSNCSAKHFSTSMEIAIPAPKSFVFLNHTTSTAKGLQYIKAISSVSLPFNVLTGGVMMLAKYVSMILSNDSIASYPSCSPLQITEMWRSDILSTKYSDHLKRRKYEASHTIFFRCSRYPETVEKVNGRHLGELGSAVLDGDWLTVIQERRRWRC